MGSRTFLIGGGWDTAEVYEPFLRAAGDAPRIGCVIADEGDGEEQFARYEGALRKAGDCVPVPLLVPLGTRLEAERAADVDGVLVCGGLTPAYQEAFTECLEELPRLLAERGIPYAGFSAGAAVAARHAVVGGWLLDGVPVCPQDSAEDLAEIDVRPGLGLVPFGVDVHAAQWGTLPRLAAAVARGYVPYGIAIDENTLVELGDDGHARVSGLGRAHVVRPAEGDAVLVRSHAAGESIPLP
ncbi:hypothetical protein [Streptomyces sp. NPDC005209]|uniref:hypothetical protein n=1 Tax=Streptomyces sp. NPDC005209 TaxID=3156715 RepID=UPI0033B5B349